MVQLFSKDVKTMDRNSSKGNQMKWHKEGFWYKADYTGYEGLAEYIVSKLLHFSNLPNTEYVDYDTEEILYKNRCYLGCRSKNFLPEGWQLITLERLFQGCYQKSLYQTIFTIENKEKRLETLVDYTVRLTGLKEFGVYMSKLLTVDALFLNEDRHTHNIAVLLDSEGIFHYCPIFDNGAGLMADTSLDYPLTVPLEQLFGNVSPKTFSGDFDEQLDVAEILYGQHLKFHFSPKDILRYLEKEENYSDEIKERVFRILLEQKRKYLYLFE